MNLKEKRIAILSPVAWRTPPRKYGAWETVASNICEGLVEKGWKNVTLFATGDSITKAKLHSVIDTGYEEDQNKDPKVCEYLHICEVYEHAGEFDLIHNHCDFMGLVYSKLVKIPVLTTIHGFSSPKILPVYEKYNNHVHYVSISDSDRALSLKYLATVYNGIDLKQFTFYPDPGDNLVWLGRIHPDKGVHLAVELSKRTQIPLIIAGIIQDKKYFSELVEPHIDNKLITFIGAVGPKERDELFSKALAVVHLNLLPERFGLVMAEAMACGVPVIAMDRGSCREVIEDKKTGYLVNNIEDAVKAIDRIEAIDRRNCRKRVELNFTTNKMVEKYEKVYELILNNKRI
ncbi:MAG: glycosyltransferase family 4 protein [Candidatus Humimicrobiaceae bacterium]